MMEYKGYLGKVEFDDEAGIFHGEAVDTRDVITFQGQSVAEQLQVAVGRVKSPKSAKAVAKKTKRRS